MSRSTLAIGGYIGLVSVWAAPVAPMLVGGTSAASGCTWSARDWERGVTAVFAAAQGVLDEGNPSAP